MRSVYSQRLVSIAVAVLVLVLGACSHPSDKSITAFSESTAAITSIAASASDLQIEIDDKTQAITAAVGFADPNGARPAGFPPPAGAYSNTQLKKDWAACVMLLKAIGAYAKALAEANDPNLAKSISDTTAGIAGALANFQAAAVTSGGGANSAYVSQRTQLIGGILADAASLATKLYTAAKMHEIMASMHPKLEDAHDLIKEDLCTIGKGLHAQRNTYQRRLIDKLKIHSNDTRLTTVDRYNLYLAVTTELAALNAKIGIVQDSADGMDAMVVAHTHLQTPETAAEANIRGEQGATPEQQQIIAIYTRQPLRDILTDIVTATNARVCRDTQLHIIGSYV